MRLLGSSNFCLPAARALIVVIGLLGIVSMMGAAPKQPPLTRVAPAALLLTPLKSPPAKSDSSTSDKHLQIELLHDVSDRAVEESELVVESLERTISMEVTAYCACTKCCGPNAAGITASGRDTTYNNSQFVAADPSLPFGTRLMVPGYSEEAVEVIDRGSAIRGDKIDVFFSSHEAALEWGRRQVNVVVLP